MPAAAVIGAAATIGGAALQHRGQSNAARAQQRAAQQATALERERDTEARRRYDMTWEEYRTRRAAYDQRLAAVLARHGYTLPSSSPAAGPAGPGAPAPVGGGAGAGAAPPPVDQSFGRRMVQLPGMGGGGFEPNPIEPASLTPNREPNYAIPGTEDAPPAGAEDPALTQDMTMTNLPRTWSEWRRYGA